MVVFFLVPCPFYSYPLYGISISVFYLNYFWGICHVVFDRSHHHRRCPGSVFCLPPNTENRRTARYPIFVTFVASNMNASVTRRIPEDLNRRPHQRHGEKSPFCLSSKPASMLSSSSILPLRKYRSKSRLKSVHFPSCLSFSINRFNPFILASRSSIKWRAKASKNFGLSASRIRIPHDGLE